MSPLKLIRALAPFLILTAIALSCQSSDTAVPTDTVSPTLPATAPATPEPSPTAVPPTSLPPEPPGPITIPGVPTSGAKVFDVGARLGPETVLVFQASDGTLLFTDPGLGVLRSVALPSEDTQVLLSGAYVTYLDVDSTGTQGVTVLATDGATSFAPMPDSTGNLASYGLSPEGARIAWLFDVTETRPSMVDGCDPNAGCVGLIYDLFLTDSAGAQPELVWQQVIESYVGVERLEVIGWREDSQALFLGLDSGALGPFYPPEFDVVYEVVLGPETEVRERSAGYIAAEEMAISDDGQWLAVAGGPDSLTVESDDGRILPVPYTTYPNPYAAQLRFSPSAERLAWVELTTPEREISIVSLFLDVMSMETGEVFPVARFAVDVVPPSLPLVGPWLTDDLLVVDHAGQTWAVDVVSRQVLVWPPELTDLSSARVVGAIAR